MESVEQPAPQPLFLCRQAELVPTRSAMASNASFQALPKPLPLSSPCSLFSLISALALLAILCSSAAVSPAETPGWHASTTEAWYQAPHQVLPSQPGSLRLLSFVALGWLTRILPASSSPGEHLAAEACPSCETHAAARTRHSWPPHRGRGRSLISSPGAGAAGQGQGQEQAQHSLEEEVASRYTHQGPDFTWAPPPERYLLLTCFQGRISNQIKCMRKALKVAVLLNRTLLVPPKNVLVYETQVDAYNTSTLVDWGRMAACLRASYGNATVMTFEEYFQRHSTAAVEVTGVRCAATRVSSCFNAWKVGKLLEALQGQLRMPPMATSHAWVHASFPPDTKTVSQEQLVEALGNATEKVLCVGDLFALLLEAPHVLRRSPECSNLWRPCPAAFSLSQELSEHLLHGSFGAIHLRRGDFYQMSHMHPLSAYKAFSSVTHVASIMASQIKTLRPTPTHIYVATDARTLEVELFASLLQENLRVGGKVPSVLTMHDIFVALQGMQRRFLEDLSTMPANQTSNVGLIALEKYIVASSRVFLGTRASTFSLDIANIRCDERQSKDDLSFICSADGCLQSTCLSTPSI